MISKRTLLKAALLIAATVAARLLPHWPNVTPTTATALFSGALLPFPLSLLVPGAAMILSDIVIGFDALPITISVYLSFALIVGLGAWLRTRRSASRIILTTLASSILFYLVTNAAVWWYSGMYARTLDGLLYSYILALPFLRNSLFGDLAYTSALFLAAQYMPAAYRYLKQTLHVKSLAPERSILK